MYQNRTSSCRLPIAIFGDSDSSQETLLIEQVLRRFQSDKLGIIEHAAGDGIATTSPSGVCAQQVRWLNDRYTCFNQKGNAVELLQHVAQRIHDGDLSIGGIIITTATRHDSSELARTLSENERISACFYIDTVIGMPDADQHAEGECNEAQERNVFPNAEMQMDADTTEFEQAQLLMARLRANVALTSNEGSANMNHITRLHETDVAAISSNEPDSSPTELSNHCNDIGSFVFRSNRPFHFERLGTFMAATLQAYRDNLLRYKGVLYFSGCVNRVLFKGADVRMSSEAGPEWGAMEDRESTMIFVGRNLPREALAAGLEQCLADKEQAWKL